MDPACRHGFGTPKTTAAGKERHHDGRVEHGVAAGRRAPGADLSNLGKNGPRDVTGLKMIHCVPDERAGFRWLITGGRERRDPPQRVAAHPSGAMEDHPRPPGPVGDCPRPESLFAPSFTTPGFTLIRGDSRYRQ